MSHYSCMVIGEGADEMLAPFDANTDVAPYRSYDEAEKPADHWSFESLVEDGEVGADADWPTLVAAHNARWEDEQLDYDPAEDRVYRMSTDNPVSTWDWYVLGGRWRGFFKLVDSPQYPDDVVLTERGWSSSDDDSAQPGRWADQARKVDIDWEGMKALAEAQAVERHAQVRAALAGHPPLMRWSHFRDSHPEDISAAQEAYAAQPGMRALREADLPPWLEDAVDEYHLEAEDPAAAYVVARRANAIVPYYLLSADGWAGRSEPRWFGLSADERPDWPEFVAAVIGSSRDNELFGLYDLHL